MTKLILFALTALSVFAQDTIFIRRRLPAGAPPCSLTVTTNLAFHYKADDPANVCTGGCSDGNVITTLHDSSGNGNDAVNASSANTYETNEIDGKPAIHFNGSNTKMVLTTPVRLAPGAVFAVLKSDVTGTARWLIGGPANSVAWRVPANTKMQDVEKQLDSSTVVGTAASDTSWHQLSVRFTTDAAAALRIDKTDDGSNSGNAITADSDVIGAALTSNDTASFQGFIAEIFGYDTAAPDTTDRGTNESYVTCRYPSL